MEFMNATITHDVSFRRRVKKNFKIGPDGHEQQEAWRRGGPGRLFHLCLIFHFGICLASNGWNLFFAHSFLFVYIHYYLCLFCACFVTCYSKILYCFDFEVTRISFFGFFVILFSYLSFSIWRFWKELSWSRGAGLKFINHCKYTLNSLGHWKESRDTIYFRSGI